MSAQTAPAKSQPVLDVNSMDTSVDPCADFFTYSCGAWIKKNPIPPDQTSWSVYSKLEDDNKVILREILESAAAAPTPDRDAVKQKIGDYYAACMDEKAIDAAAIKPLQPILDRIQQMQSKQDIANVAGTMVSSGALFRFRSDQDYKDSTQVIAELDQGGLGLPDRDYYLKTDAKSVELRKAYVAHLQKMFELLGDKPDAAAAQAQTVMRIETALAKGSLTRVERRDPQKLYHKMTTQQLDALSPSFQWKTYFAKVGLSPVEALNVETPEFFKTLNAELENEDLASWKTYLRWHLVNANAPFLSSDFVNADFDFYGKTLQGAAGTRAAMEALRRLCGQRSGRSSGASLCGASLQSRGQAARPEDGEGNRRRHGAGHQFALLDDARDETAGAGKTACRRQQDRLSRQVARLQHARPSLATTKWAMYFGPASSNFTVNWPRSASRWIAANGR